MAALQETHLPGGVVDAATMNMVLLWMVAAQVAPVTPAVADPPRVKVAMLPVVVQQDLAVLRDVVPMLSATLAARLQETGRYTVITTQEVAALVAAESERQALGCTDDGCLAELVGALGAQQVLTSALTATGGTLVWNSVITEQASGTVVGRMSVQAASTDALLAQVPEVVLGLTGQVGTPDQQRTRLGFLDASGYAAFQKARARTPDRTTSEALTAFLMEHNLESRGLAVAQALAFGGAAVVVGLLALVSYGYLLAVIYPNAYVLLAGTMVAWMLIPTALGLGLVGLSLAAVDALNLGRVEVAQRGCCRDDAELEEAQQHTAVEQVAGLVVLLGGPVAVTAVVMASVVSAVVVVLLGLGARVEPSLRGDPDRLYPVPVAVGAGLGYLSAFWCGLPLIVMPLCCGSPVGALLLWWPRKAVVGDVLEVPPPDKAPPQRPKRRLKKRAPATVQGGRP